MKAWVTVSQKVGAGKTSTLVSLAFDFADRELRKPAPAKPSQK
jgi:cellulose biosynthesis protein BcsQ